MGVSLFAKTVDAKAAAITACGMGFIVVNIVFGGEFANFRQKNATDPRSTAELQKSLFFGTFWPGWI
ncbi:MAG: hypothetical protein CMO74_02440 [Verrucomicrobiales bacterium]|nr:hypothetical protein [Verrucomicrobiales bacterium]